MSKSVPLLFDSVNDNTGDRAIGQVMAEFVESRGARPVIVEPLRQATLKAPVVVGGGELIGSSGDAFYEAFRLEGEHILNAAGLTTSIGLDYLKDYKYVSVRSEVDYALVSGVRPDAEITPCVATRLTPADPPDEIDPERTVLFHFHHNALHHCRGIPEVIAGLSDYEIHWLELTPYAGDGATMARIGAGLNREIVATGAGTPQEKLGAIAGSRLLICASLHGAIFAHAQNVPFLVFSRPPKVRAFLSERGLDHHGFSSTAELRDRLDTIFDERVDFSRTIEADSKKLDAHFSKLAELLGLPLKPVNDSAITGVVAKTRAQATLDTLHGIAYRQAITELGHIGHQVRGLRQVVADHDREVADARRSRSELLNRIASAENEAGNLREQVSALAGQVTEERSRAVSAEAHVNSLSAQLSAQLNAQLDTSRELIEQANAAGQRQAEFLGNISHELFLLKNELRHATETRLSRQALRLGKRLGKALWNRVPPQYQERGRPTVEKVLGRPIGHLDEAEPTNDSENHAQPESMEAMHRRRRRAALVAVTAAESPPPGSSAENSLNVSVLIPTWNAGPEFKRTLDALGCQIGLDSVELIVVDSGSTDSTLELAESAGARIEHIAQEDFNHGSTRNLLGDAATGNYLVFMTQDAVPAGPQTLAHLASLLASNSEIAACSARQVPHSGCGLHAAYTSFHHYRALDLNATLVFPEQDRAFSDAGYGEKRRWAAAVDNVCSAMRREAWEEIRFRPTRFAEDLDFAVRAMQSGWKVAFCGNTAVIHSHDRPAIYHLRRHVADRVHAAKVLEDPSLELVAPGTLGEVLVSSLPIMAAADDALRSSSRLGLLGRLGEIRSVVGALAQDGNEATFDRDAILNEELAAAADYLRDLAGQAPRSDQVERLLAIDIASHLSNPHLDEFAAVHNSCPPAQSEAFLAQLMGSFLGVAIGHAAAAVDQDDEMIQQLVSGI